MQVLPIAARITMMADNATPGCNMSFTGRTFIDGGNGSPTYIYADTFTHLGSTSYSPYYLSDSQDNRNSANLYPLGGFVDSVRSTCPRVVAFILRLSERCVRVCVSVCSSLTISGSAMVRLMLNTCAFWGAHL